MNKEKEIEEMASDIADICVDLADTSCGDKQCCTCMAKNLIEAGYRKADEVRKETAREFKETMKYIFRFILKNKGKTSIPYFEVENRVFAKIDREVDREFLQEYGVEVDE